MTDDLVKRLRRKVAKNKRTSVEVSILIGCEFIKEEAADRIEELVEALRLADAALRGANMNMGIVEKKVRAAIGEKKNER
jgi:hypothetical protein